MEATRRALGERSLFSGKVADDLRGPRSQSRRADSATQGCSKILRTLVSLVLLIADFGWRFRSSFQVTVDLLLLKAHRNQQSAISNQQSAISKQSPITDLKSTLFLTKFFCASKIRSALIKLNSSLLQAIKS